MGDRGKHHHVDLQDKVVVITGGSRGLGAVMARAFAEQGSSVVIASRKAEACEALAEELADELGVRTLGVGCHVGHWAECDELVATVTRELGPIDVLVNNAGMSPLYPSIEEVSEELFDKVVGVNLKGPFRLSALVGARMAEGEGGSIINISSISAVHPTEGELPYAAAKAGLNSLTLGFARALGPKVRVNAIMAGPFVTDVSAGWEEGGYPDQAIAASALQRAGAPEEIVGAALYFASAASSFTTGAILKVDGGAV